MNLTTAQYTCIGLIPCVLMGGLIAGIMVANGKGASADIPSVPTLRGAYQAPSSFPTINYGTTKGLSGITIAPTSTPLICQAGTYTVTAPFKQCRQCSSGFFSSATDATSCTACPVGQTNNSNYTGCKSIAIVCQPGTYVVSSGLNKQCVKCSTNFYSNVNDAFSCTSCPVGQTNNAGFTGCKLSIPIIPVTDPIVITDPPIIPVTDIPVTEPTVPTSIFLSEGQACDASNLCGTGLTCLGGLCVLN